MSLWSRVLRVVLPKNIYSDQRLPLFLSNLFKSFPPNSLRSQIGDQALLALVSNPPSCSGDRLCLLLFVNNCHSIIFIMLLIFSQTSLFTFFPLQFSPGRFSLDHYLSDVLNLILIFAHSLRIFFNLARFVLIRTVFSLAGIWFIRQSF